eukprot:1649496-Rhodomonas_salina.1
MHFGPACGPRTRPWLPVDPTETPSCNTALQALQQSSQGESRRVKVHSTPRPGPTDALPGQPEALAGLTAANTARLSPCGKQVAAIR